MFIETETQKLLAFVEVKISEERASEAATPWHHVADNLRREKAKKYELRTISGETWRSYMACL